MGALTEIVTIPDVARAVRIRLALMGPAVSDLATMELVSQATALISHVVLGVANTAIVRAVGVIIRPAVVATVHTVNVREVVAPIRPAVVAVARTDVVRTTVAREYVWISSNKELLGGRQWIDGHVLLVNKN